MFPSYVRALNEANGKMTYNTLEYIHAFRRWVMRLKPLCNDANAQGTARAQSVDQG
jgi:hypothetical protein